jgi:hypothetical protein
VLPRFLVLEGEEVASMATTTTKRTGNQEGLPAKVGHLLWRSGENRRTAIAVGLLFFIATAAYIVGSGLITSAQKAPDILSNLNSAQIRTGVLLEFIDAAAAVGIGILLFPILRKYREGMALGYAGSRIIESVLILVSALSALLLLPLSQEYLRAGAADASQLQPLGTLATAGYDLAFQMAMIALGAGSLMLCYVLYEVKLVPRALSVLGFVGYIALFASGWLAIFGNTTIGLVLFIPGAIFEIVFPLWLIVRGFNEPALSSRSGKS